LEKDNQKRLDIAFWHKVCPLPQGTIVTVKRNLVGHKKAMIGRIITTGRLEGYTDVFYSVQEIGKEWAWLYVYPREIIKVWSQEEYDEKCKR
jgi:hypothetical protein